jgi:hypothetical protein
MTKVKFINEFYYFEYRTYRGVPQRFHYYLNAEFYPFSQIVPRAYTALPRSTEKTVFSSGFLPEHAFSTRFLR